VKFRKIWQTVNKYFTLVGAPFPGKSIRPVFLKKSKTLPLQTLLFFAMCCENFERFHRRKFKKIASKAVKTEKNTLV